MLILWISLSSPAQLRVTEHLLINNGLANNYITDIVEDGKGRIWVATESGLNSYNGFNFQSYNTYNSGLNSNMINTLWYDSSNDKLWIGTKGNGVCVMDLNTCRISTLGEDDRQMNNIMNISPDANDGVWIASQTSILHYQQKTERLETISNNARQSFFQCVFDNGDGQLLVGHYLGGISLLDTKTKKTKKLLTADSQLYNESINDIVKDHKNRIWLATGKGLWYYIPEIDKLEKFDSLPADAITDIELIDGGEIWASSNAGVWIVDLSAWAARKISNLRQHSLPTYNVKKIFQDRFGNVWFGSMGNGIDFFSHEAPQFARLCQQSTWGIYQDGDGVWVGTTDRLLCFKDSTLTREIPVGRKGWESSFILSINSDDEGHLMVSHFGHLLQIDKQSGAVKEILQADGQPIFSLTFYKDQDGTLWITARDGIYTLKKGIVLRDEKLNSALSRQSIHGIRHDRQGKIWVGTYENGIYIFNKQKRLIQHLDKKSGFLSNSIQHLHVDPHEGIWLSTPDGMGYISDTNKPEEYKLFGYQQGLKDSYIRAIQEDTEGNVWVSTNNGISLLRQGSKSFVNFNKYDGIPTNNFTGGAVEAGGKMYFTSLDGLCYFNPRHLIDNRKLSGLHILNCIDLSSSQSQSERLHANGKNSRIQGSETTTSNIVIPDADSIYNLSYDQNSFRIVFGVSDQAQSHQADYQYIVREMDADWTDLSENAITFRNLSHGHYTIAIRARLKGMEWSKDNETEAKIYIHPPFWRSWWAYCLYLLVLAGMGWGYFSRYRHRLKLQSDLELERKKNLDEQERNTERLQFFTNITHELRTPLTLILGPLEELLENKVLKTEGVHSKLEMIHHSSEQLKNLITQLLEFRKTETHNRQLTVMRQDLAKTIKKVGRSFSELNTNPRLRYLISVEDTPQELYYDEDVITTILNNLMSNAAKYTPKGEIELSLTGNEKEAVITVRDTGYGIAAEAIPRIFDRYYQAKGPHQASGTGIGLALVKSLCILHEIDISVNSKEGEGATFTLTLNKTNTYPNALHKDNSEEMGLAEQLVDEINTSDNQQPLILVVEDNTEIRHYIANSLSEDYQVIKASDGKIGCEKAFDQIPDLIITDIMMPVMDGTELCRRLKQDIRTSHIPIVMLTAKDTQADQQEGYEVGADSYLTKPFSISMLRSRIINLLTARQRLASYLTATTTESKTGEDSLTQSIGAESTKESSDVPENHLSQLDQQFLTDITDFIEKNITDPNLTMAIVGEAVNMSHSTLYRKIKALTGISGNEFIRKIRLHHSIQLMLKEHRNVSEAAYESGFNSIPYFRSCFKEEFGMPPTEYIKNI